MAEALADRLAEAFAEKLHELVRRQDWGYAPDENITVDDMLKVKYQVRGSTYAAQGAEDMCCHAMGETGVCLALNNAQLSAAKPQPQCSRLCS